MSKKRVLSLHPLQQTDLIQCVLRFLEPFEVIGLTSVNKFFKIATQDQCAFSTKFQLTHSHGFRSRLQAYCNGREIGRSISWSKVIQTPRICDLIHSVNIDSCYKRSLTILFDLRNISIVRVFDTFAFFPIERIRKNVESISFWCPSRSLRLKYEKFPELRTIYVRGLWEWDDVNNFFENSLPEPKNVPRLSSVRIAGTLRSGRNMSGLNRYPQVERLDIKAKTIENGLPTEALFHIKKLILKCIPKERDDPYDYDWISWLPNLKTVVMPKRDNVQIIVPSGVQIERF